MLCSICAMLLCNTVDRKPPVSSFHSSPLLPQLRLPRTLIYNTRPTQTSSLRENKQQHTRVSSIIILSCWTTKNLKKKKYKKMRRSHATVISRIAVVICCEPRHQSITSRHEDWMWDLLSQRPTLLIHLAFGLSGPRSLLASAETQQWTSALGRTCKHNLRSY